MDIEEIVDVAAPVDRVWHVMTDVERWPDWTDSIQHVQLLTPPPLTLGSQARIRQPRLPTATWTVVDITAAEYFEWWSTAPGIKSVAGHRVESIAPDISRVTLTLDWSGPLAGLIRMLWGQLSRDYVAMEARGLKSHCESQPH